MIKKEKAWGRYNDTLTLCARAVQYRFQISEKNLNRRDFPGSNRLQARKPVEDLF